MRAFILLLIFAGLAVGGYIYKDQVRAFITELTGGEPEVVEESPPEPGTTKVYMDGAPPQPEEGSNPTPGATTTAGTGNPGTTPPKPADPGTSTTGGPKPAPKDTGVGNNDEFAEMFPMPEFRSLEEIVGNWQAIPASAFPRVITIHKETAMTLQGGVGSSVLPTGSKVTAMSIEGDTLTVAANRTSPVRGSIGIDDTDLKEVLAKVYEGFKKRRVNYVLAQREQARRKKMAGVLAARAADAAKSSLLGPKPEVAANGTVPVMAASISNKDVTEFHLGMIKAWGPVLYDEIEGEPYWTGTVNYDAKTIFGTFPAEAMALIRKGKVLKWIYSGSHEPVP